MSIKAIITDLDGTLLPGGEKKLSPENWEALENAGKAGIVRIVATGRSPFSFRKTLPENLPIDYLVFSSGAGIMEWNNKSVLSGRHLEAEAVREIFTFLSGYGINFSIHREIPNNHLYYNTAFEPANPDFLRRESLYPEQHTTISSVEDIKGEITQFLMILEKEQLGLFEEIQTGLSHYSVIRSTSPIDHESIWLEIFHPEVYKGNGCTKLLNLLNISWEETAGLGNDYNDIDFLKLTPHGYVVENTPEDIKRMFKTVPSDRHNGFSEFANLHLP